MSYKNYASTFCFEVFDSENVIPIEVGAANRSNFLYELRDDSGDNISVENPFYGEMTGLYWIWKNVKIESTDIIGFRHYNKRLWVSKEKVTRLINNGIDFIVCKGQVIPSYTRDNDLQKLTNILKSSYPECYKAFLEIYEKDGSSSKCNAKNTFFTTGEQFNEYCSFLFDVLGQLRKEVGDVPNREKKRYCALLAERLLSAYILGYKKKKYEVDIRYNRLWMSIIKIVINRLPFNNNSQVLRFFRKKTYSGSYKRSK